MGERMEDWLSQRSVLMTGATGSLGQSMVALLDGKVSKLRLLMRKPAGDFSDTTEIFQGDLIDPLSLSGIADGFDTLIHLASYSPLSTDVDPENHPSHLEVTAQGTENLLKAIASSGINRIAFASSVRSLENSDQMTVYGQAKQTAEQLIFDHARQHRIHASVVRFPAFYGNQPSAISAMTQAISWGRFPPIPEFGNRRSFIHVADAARALLDVAKADPANGRGFVATDGEEYSTRKLYEGILQSLGRKPPSWTIPQSMLELLAKMGNLGEILLHRPLPFNSRVLNKLRQSNWFDDHEIRQVAGFQSSHRVWDTLPKSLKTD